MADFRKLRTTTRHLETDRLKSSPPPQREAFVPWAKSQPEACGGSGEPAEAPPHAS